MEPSAITGAMGQDLLSPLQGARGSLILGLCDKSIIVWAQLQTRSEMDDFYSKEQISLFFFFFWSPFLKEKRSQT